VFAGGNTLEPVVEGKFYLSYSFNCRGSLEVLAQLANGELARSDVITWVRNGCHSHVPDTSIAPYVAVQRIKGKRFQIAPS